MVTVNVQEAKTRLSNLLARAATGEEVVIARAGTPVARLVPVDASPSRKFGGLAMDIPDDFDAPLDEADLQVWE